MSCDFWGSKITNFSNLSNRRMDPSNTQSAMGDDLDKAYKLVVLNDLFRQ